MREAKSYSDPIGELAYAALKQPSDSWFGNERLWIDCGMSGWGRSRDSKHLDNANFETVIEVLTEKFGPPDSDEDSTNPNMWWVNGASHWAVGWVDQIMVRILKVIPEPENDYYDFDDEVYDEDNITDIFKECIELHQAAEEYAVLDDAKLSEMEYAATFKNMDYEKPSWSDFSEEQKSDIFSWLWEHNIYAEGDDNDWFSEGEIGAACFALGFIDPEYMEELAEWIEGYTTPVEGGWRYNQGIASLLIETGDWFAAVEHAEKYKDQGSLL